MPKRTHPILRRLLYALWLTVAVAVLLEIGLRLVVRWDPGYYVAYRDPEPGAVLEYPYGTIRINSLGFNDAEFDEVKGRPRIAYMGDSVCAGVGAGYGHRVSELLESALPQYEHLNLGGGLATGMEASMIESYLAAAERFDIDVVVYLMNMNDIGPEGRDDKAKRLTVFRIGALFDWLRGRSYLYTWVRMCVKNAIESGGWTQSGVRQYELWPGEHAPVIDATAARVNEIGRRLAEDGRELVVVMLPYEMQISEDAAQTYAELGVSWEEGFQGGSTQRALASRLETGAVVDAREAFVDEADPGATRSAWKVGECFVYDRGDKIDWNHPNREGHRLIAEWLERTGVIEAAAARAAARRAK